MMALFSKDDTSSALLNCYIARILFRNDAHMGLSQKSPRKHRPRKHRPPRKNSHSLGKKAAPWSQPVKSLHMAMHNPRAIPA